VTCPNGVTRRITRRRKVTFGVACRGCPLRSKCTTRDQGRILNMHEHDAVLRQARRDWATRDGLRETYRQHRPMVERSISWLIGPKNRCRQLRYRGVRNNNQWLHLRMTGLNLRRMINLGLRPASAAPGSSPAPPEPRPRCCHAAGQIYLAALGNPRDRLPWPSEIGHAPRKCNARETPELASRIELGKTRGRSATPLATHRQVKACAPAYCRRRNKARQQDTVTSRVLSERSQPAEED
jgi:hypothetical protein